MIGFEYKYKSPIEIIHNLGFLSDYSVLWLILIIISIIITISLIIYIGPIISIWLDYRELENEKLEKKNFLKLMILQKNLEEEIENELNI